MAGAIFFPAGLFWLAWTSAPRYSVWLTAMRSVSFSLPGLISSHLLIIASLWTSGIPFGLGLLAIFQGCMQYMIDAYGPYASSAVSCRD